MSKTAPAIEALESRIAPALLFVSAAAQGAASLKVLDAAGENAQNTPQENAAQTATGATAAVLLQAGDQLIFDRNSNHVLDPGDRVMAEVTAGQALFFLKDGPTGVKRHAFELTEITGAAVSEGFAGSIRTDVNGSIVTALDATGALTVAGSDLQITHSVIARLTIDGQIAARVTTKPTISYGGHLLAGGGLSDVSVGAALFNRGVAVSVAGRVATGDATAEVPRVTFDAGQTVFRTLFTLAPGENGGDIDGLRLRNGVGPLGIFSGTGGNQLDAGTAGDGGSIGRVVIGKQASALLVHAAGGGIGINGANGGAGGTVQDSAITIAKRGVDVSIVGGEGGASSIGTAGARGGIHHVSVIATTDINKIQMLGGELSDLHLALKGVTATTDGTPALRLNGISIDNLTMSVGRGGGSEQFLVTAGTITDAHLVLNGNVGNFSLRGQTVERLQLQNRAVQSVIQVGGDILRGFSFLNEAAGVQQIDIGGKVASDLSITNTAPRLQFLRIMGGADDTAAPDLSDVRITNSGTIGGLVVQAGAGQVRGGDISHVSIIDMGRLDLREPVLIEPGGAVSFNSAASVGDISDVVIDAPRSAFVIGRDGAAGSATTPALSGGAGGSISHVIGRAAGLQVLAAHGGASPSGTGGAGGSISDVQFTLVGGIAQRIAAGNGGAGLIGGTGGSVSNVHIEGDIGAFTKRFGFDESQMGGLAVGRAGTSSSPLATATAGSISDVAAHRIAAVVAGRPIGTLDATNAVESIANLNTRVLGADTRIRGPHRAASPAGGTFDFSGGNDNSFTLGEDVPIDGLVIVQGGGLLTPLPVTPLKLIFV